MTATGSAELWRIADGFGLVPVPPNRTLAQLFAAWWSQPRRFGCTSASRSPAWVVIAPSPEVYCPTCALQRLRDEDRCCYCGRDVSRRRRSSLLFEQQSRGIRFVGVAHPRCEESQR
jgi:hypothetical protein